MGEHRPAQYHGIMVHSLLEGTTGAEMARELSAARRAGRRHRADRRGLGNARDPGASAAYRAAKAGDTAASESNFGVLRRGFAAKPAFGALRRVLRP